MSGSHGSHSHGGQPHGSHGHAHGGFAPGGHNAAFAIGTALNLGFVAVELAFGYLANSLALVSDAVHNLSDVFGLVLAWGAAWLATWRPTRRRTYGWRRASILAALGNAVLLFVAVGAIAVEAVHRWLEPQPVAGTTVVVVAAIGIAINGITAWLFMRGREHDLNIRGAFQHMLADALVSVAVVLTALGISITGWLWLDPAMSLLVAAVILVGTWGLARSSLDLAMDAVPEGIDPAEIEAFLAGLPGVTAVADLHIWAMSTTETALTVHLARPAHALDDDFLLGARRALSMRFGIAHATLQIGSGTGEERCVLGRVA